MSKPAIHVLSEFDLKFQMFLISEFEKKKTLNPRYSLRAFAQLVRLDQSLMSKILKGKKSLAPATMVRILNQLGATPETVSEFIRHERSSFVYNEVSEDDLAVLSDWKHFAILELGFLKNFRINVASVGEKLSLSEVDAQAYLDRLVSTKHLAPDGDDYRVLSQSNSWATVKKTSRARIDFQKGVLEKSLTALDEIPFEFRDHSSVIFTLNKKDVEEYRNIIKETRDRLVELFQKSQDHDEVFQLAISLFPVTWKGKA